MLRRPTRRAEKPARRSKRVRLVTRTVIVPRSASRMRNVRAVRSTAVILPSYWTAFAAAAAGVAAWAWAGMAAAASAAAGRTAGGGGLGGFIGGPRPGGAVPALWANRPQRTNQGP